MKHTDPLCEPQSHAEVMSDEPCPRCSKPGDRVDPRVEPHVYRGWVDENDIGNTCCLAPRTDPIHIEPAVPDAEAFPPRIISKWLRRGTVNSDVLVAELRYWAIKMGGGDPTGDPVPAVDPRDAEIARLKAEVGDVTRYALRASGAAWAVIHSLYDAGDTDADVLAAASITAPLNERQTKSLQAWFAAALADAKEHQP